MTQKRNKKQPNSPPEGEPWVWKTAKLLNSPAWKSMSINARRALDRIELEHMAHAGIENGNLIVTHEQFVEYGVSRDRVGDAIDELEYLKLIQITQRGRAGKGTGYPNKFELTWLSPKGRHFCSDIWKRTKPEHVKSWKSSGREAAKKRRIAKTPKRELSPDENYFSTPERRGGPLPEGGVKTNDTHH